MNGKGKAMRGGAKQRHSIEVQGVAEEKRSKARIGEAKAWRSKAELSAAKEWRGNDVQWNCTEQQGIDPKERM